MDDCRDENTKPEWEATWFEAELRLKTIAQETSLPFQQQEHIIAGRGRGGLEHSSSPERPLGLLSGASLVFSPVKAFP